MNEIHSCPMCTGNGQHLGILGTIAWLRCEDCGWEFFRAAEPEQEETA
jgi:rubredoxin